jgi:hypothetical protein
MPGRIMVPAREPTEVDFPDLLELSARRYLAALHEARPRFSTQGLAAADRLVATIEAALEQKADLRPVDLVFGSRSLDDTTADDRLSFVNQFVLGTGWDGAPITVMGTEAAEDYAAGNAEGLAFHCLYIVLQLAGGSIEILREMAEGSSWVNNVADWTAPRRRYDFEPNDLLQLNMGRPRTWRIVAEVAAVGDGSEWRGLFHTGDAALGLGALTYQIERSARSALTAVAGSSPTPTRTEFLVADVIPRIRANANTLLLHGFGGGPWKDWWASDERLIQAFLGSDAHVPFDFSNKVGGQAIEFAEANEHRAIYTRALNGAVSAEYKRLVRDLIHRETAPWPPVRT